MLLDNSIPVVLNGYLLIFQVIPITTNSVRVEWTPLFPDSWSGDASSGGYRVKYRQMSDIPTAFSMQHEELRDTLAREAVLLDLQVGQIGIIYSCILLVVLITPVVYTIDY